MANYQYHNEAIKAFQFLDEALRPFVKQEMIAVYKEDWLRNIANSARWERDEPIWDTLALLHTMRVNWNSVFKMDKLRGPEEIGRVSALIDWRHRIQGHSSKPVDKEEAEDAIRSILHLLRRIGAATEVGEVEHILLLFTPQPSVDAADLPQEAQIEDQNSPLSNHITEKLAEGQKKLENMMLSTEPRPAIVIADPEAELVPVIELSETPLTMADLRVERVKKPNSTMRLLQIYDGDTFIGSYERSTTEAGAKEKEIEIRWPDEPDKRNLAADELRKAYAKNGKKPFIVRWTGEATGQDGKKGVKQIRDEKSGEILGEFPKCCFRK